MPKIVNPPKQKSKPKVYGGGSRRPISIRLEKIIKQIKR